MLQNQFIFKNSKTSEKIAYLQKKVYQNPPHRSRCRYERRKKGQIEKQNFFGSAKVAPGCKCLVFINFANKILFDNILHVPKKPKKVEELLLDYLFKKIFERSKID